jgi:tetratricopeptide (TPR) repeat protein
MIRSILIAGVFGILAAASAVYILSVPYLLSLPARQGPAVTQPGVNSAAAEIFPDEAWPLCSSTRSLAESADWAALDPDFAAGKRAIAGNDWIGAIRALTLARDDRNGDIQNYFGYAYRRLQLIDPAMCHYQQSLTLDPRHRSAHEHLGEAYLAPSELIKAEEHLAALVRICLIPEASNRRVQQVRGALAK